MTLIQTPSQTAGPYVHLGLTDKASAGCLIGPEVKGERIRLMISIIDGDGVPASDAIVEIWQANAEGKYNHPDDTHVKQSDANFCGFGRLATGQDGSCVFETIRSGCVPSPAGKLQAPHVNVSIFSRGLLKRLATRIYFVDNAANTDDPILALVPVERRATLMARPDPAQPSCWKFDIHLCGPSETVFFDI